MNAWTLRRVPGSPLSCAALVLVGMGSGQAAAPVNLRVLADLWTVYEMDTAMDVKMTIPDREVFYKGGKPPVPTKVDAYTTKRFSAWFELPGYVADDYSQGRIRFNTSYVRGWYQNDSIYLVPADTTIALPDSQTVFTFRMPGVLVDSVVHLGSDLPKSVHIVGGATYKVRKLYTAAAVSETGILNLRSNSFSDGEMIVLPGVIDSCIARFGTDTLWISWSSSSGRQSSDMRCSDHDPFFPSKGKVSVFSPWTGSKGWALVNGHRQQLIPGTLPGWMQTDVWTLPGDASEVQVRFAFERWNGDVATVDSAGAAYHVDPGAKMNYVLPEMGSLPGYRRGSLTDSVVFAWRNPWNSRLAALVFGGDERIQGAWHPDGWFSAKVWGRPAKAGLVSTDGDSATAWVVVPAATPGKLDTVWLTSKPAAAVQLRLDGTAYDYKLGNRGIKPNASNAPKDTSAYFPFSQSMNSDLVTGLVGNRLKTDGRLAGTGASICGAAVSDSMTDCKDPANAPDKWFGPVFRGSKAMNASHPLSLLVSDVQKGFLSYSDTSYFPLDAFERLAGSSAPNPFYDTLEATDGRIHNFGFCVELHGQAQLIPGGVLTVATDDDTWVFLDSQLVIDMGGQHARASRTLVLDELPRPLPPLASVDIFHCERHINQSSLSLSTNFPIQPVGTVKVLPRTTSIGSREVGAGRIALKVRARTVSVLAAQGQLWSLESRTSDGRLGFSMSGTGPANIPWVKPGLSILTLRSGSETVRQKFLSTHP